MTRWKQCPYCARWFIANKRQIYDTPKCRQNFNAKLNRLRNETSYHYVSIRGEMYERSSNDNAS